MNVLDSSMAYRAICSVNAGLLAYCKFLSANDTGNTGAHQAGIYIAKSAISILFNEPGNKGQNLDRLVSIIWQDDFTTKSRFIYYGRETRDEYRITRFGQEFPYLKPNHTGDLFVLIKMNEDEYKGYVLETEEDINNFLEAFNIGPTDTGTLIQKETLRAETKLDMKFAEYISSLCVDFPISSDMSATARQLFNMVNNHEENITLNPDLELISWVDAEFRLFRRLELERYGHLILQGFSSMEQFVEVANTVLNRRKSRAGKSLENHLSAIFDGNELKYSAQPVTEGNKRPDFLFPSQKAYHDSNYPTEDLIFLGAKTTCKDRWRQIINEANRIRVKHLFTLQQGISPQQMDEMAEEKIILIVPKQYINTYPKEKRDCIWTLKKFIDYAKEKSGV